ncbi:hypothetical protein GOP47_0023201 [Adiantum capillus-veneris]|uniref:Pentatricopeptide repeat-containing protein n=1 Tax=Adiantum capillus-veneris TaxID=13818 RepID=A0A9D4Z6Q8_ADICA|nr:hypothetical protein GOP47_0023201 [Adiantum capillus-veneris]
MLPYPSLQGIGRILHTFITEKNYAGGVSMHAFLRNHGLSAHVVLGSRVVCMLVEIGCLQSAHQVFNSLVCPDVWSWNALIGGFVKSGDLQQGLSLYQEMQRDVSLHSSGHTFTILLRACMQLRDWITGLHLHAEVARTGLLATNAFVGSTLVQMYVKCGFLSKAQQAFDNLPARDTVLWTSLMTGYLENGLGDEAVKCFDQMESDSASPDAFTIVCALKACASIGNSAKGQEIHAEVERQGIFKRNIVVGNALVDMYGKFGMLSMAQQVLDRLRGRNVVSWNTLITCYAELGHGGEALECFERMQTEGIKPDSVTLIGILKACCSIGAVEKAAEIYDEVERDSLESELVVASTLVHMYARCGQLSLAQHLFDSLLIRDAIIWTALMAGYAEHGQGEEALDLLELMQLEGVSPNAVTYVSSLKACSGTGAIHKGAKIHAEIERQGLLEKDLVLGNTLVDMYAKCGLLPRAQEVFDLLPSRDVISWNALISGYAQLGKGGEVGDMLDRMLGEKVNPDAVTLIVVLSACLRAGILHKCETYFVNMSKEYGVVPSIKHHACLVDHFCREGYLDKATLTIRKMPVSPNLVIWHTLLSACRKWENFEFGRQAFEHAVSLDMKDASAYYFMSQICAGSH